MQIIQPSRKIKPAHRSWTEEQWEAIIAAGQHVLVSASAGSGKTAVLVERLLTRIANEKAPLNIDEILVATFTKAAAVEMKERIRNALEAVLEYNLNSQSLTRQLALLPKAQITTLHAFCHTVVQQYAHLIQLDAKFRTMEDAEGEILKWDTLDALFEQLYAEEKADRPENKIFLTRLADRFGNEQSDIPLQKIILDLYTFSRSHPWPETWLKRMAAQFFEIEVGQLVDSLWVKTLLQDTILQLQGSKHKIIEALHLVDQPCGPKPYQTQLEIELNDIQQAIEILSTQKNWTAWQMGLGQITFSRLPVCKGDEFDTQLTKQVQTLRDKAKKKVAKVADDWLQRSPEQYVLEMHSIAEDMACLVDCVLLFGLKYEEVKRVKNLLDFNDLEHLTLRILRDPSSDVVHSFPSEIAVQLREKYKEIFLDEYQDMNEVQEAIITLIAHEHPGNVFMVGDMKQSIYKFRLAEPEIFLHKYKTFSSYRIREDSYPCNILPQDGVRIDLTRNFRSRPEILNAVNFVFTHIMREPVGEMTYDEQAKLRYGETYPEKTCSDYKIEFSLIEMSSTEVTDASESNGADPSQEENLEATQLEARFMARKIRILLGEETHEPFSVYDQKLKSYRPIRLQDIVILVRSLKATVSILHEELKSAGIPIAVELPTGYFFATEVRTMISLLTVIDNPQQDIPLAGVLHSPLCGLTAEDLARIRLTAGKEPFWKAVYVAGQSNFSPGPGSLKKDSQRRLKLFLQKVTHWRDKARREPLGELISLLYRETGYYDFVGGQAGGMQRQANLRALVERAIEYERTSRFRGLFRFLRFLKQLQDRGLDLGTAHTLGESEDAVRIMSIHGSKGLEYPVIFLAGLGRQFNLHDMHTPFIKHKKLGFGPRVFKVGDKVAFPSLPQLAIRKKMRAEMLAEEMRMLYVAMTRAKEKLFLVGASKAAGQKWSRWAKNFFFDGLTADQIADAVSYLDWLGPAAAAAVKNADESLRWKVHFSAASDYTTLTTEKAASNWDGAQISPVNSSSEHENNLWKNEVNRLLSWTYPYQALTEISAKTSITELKERENFLKNTENIGQIEYLTAKVRKKFGLSEHKWRFDEGLNEVTTFRLRRPRFMSSYQISSVEKGTAYHLVMQHLPLHHPLDNEEIAHLMEDLVKKRILSPSQKQSVNLASIENFYKTELFLRMQGAKRIFREVPFTYSVPIGQLYPEHLEQAKSTTMLVQGVLDCLLQEEDGLILVDYKTDRLTGHDTEKVALQHQFQMHHYTQAVQQITGLKVKKAYVFFLATGESVGF